jgi:hypothetical protein
MEPTGIEPVTSCLQNGSTPSTFGPVSPGNARRTRVRSTPRFPLISAHFRGVQAHAPACGPKPFAVASAIAGVLVFAALRGYHWPMATAVRRLDLTVGELVEIAGRRYEVVPDREGGVTIEPPITPAAELHARRGTKPASAEDFERLSVDVPSDDEG